MNPDHVLILPGWQNSGAGHWQTLWETAHGYPRVEQHDWMRPLRGDWVARLEDVVLDCAPAAGPVVLVAHSLGCILVAAWAAHSRNTHRVQAALLVAPGDPEREALREILPGWSPVPRARLPFRSVLVGSRNDPFCSFERAQALAAAWGSRFVDAGEQGHLNAESNLGAWPSGHAQLCALVTQDHSGAAGSSTPSPN